MDQSVRLGSLTLKNPVITASGTFGYGLEFMRYGDLGSLGGICLKGISLAPRAGNAMPRIAETPCGMLNAIGLQNVGVQAFLKDKLPYLAKTRRKRKTRTNTLSNSKYFCFSPASILLTGIPVHVWLSM